MSRMMRAAAIAVFALAMVSCAPLDQVRRSMASLDFRAPLAVNAEGEFHVSLEVHNGGTVTFPQDTGFGGVMELRDGGNNLLARVYAREITQIEPGQSAFPGAWSAQLGAGSYRLTWGAPDYGSILVEFTIAEEEGRLRLQEMAERPDAPRSLPAAGDYGEAHILITKAIADLATRLGIKETRITIESFSRAVFPDTSLGVPEEGQVYAQVVTPGYLLVLKANGTSYRYHGSGEFIAPAQERPTVFPKLKLPTRARLPVPTPTPDANLIISAIPDSAHVLAQVSGNIDGDSGPEEIVLAGYGGGPDRLGYERLDLFIIAPERSDQPVVWQLGLAGDRAEAPELLDVDGNGVPEVLVKVAQGAAGESLYVLSWRKETYELLRPSGGRFDGQDTFGEVGARVEDVDGDGLLEILASYGPAAASTDVYHWDGQRFIHVETLREGN